MRSPSERDVPEPAGRRLLAFWMTIVSFSALWHAAHGYYGQTVYREREENPQRMWDPEKGNIIGHGRSTLLIGLENVTLTNQTAQIGSTAYLHCRVRHMADKQVSWIRRRDYHILTSGRHTYSQDQRFSVVRPEEGDDWALQIKFVQERDEGAYECQVSTKTGRYGYLVNLRVVVPEAIISGTSEIHVESGSTISLLCIIEGAINPPQFIFWYHNSKMINYDQSREGISVTMDDHDFASSRLTITNASFKDSGVYNCSTSNTVPSSVNVYVSEGDKTAAIQRLGSTSLGNISVVNHLFLSFLITLQILLVHKNISISNGT